MGASCSQPGNLASGERIGRGRYRSRINCPAAKSLKLLASRDEAAAFVKSAVDMLCCAISKARNHSLAAAHAPASLDRDSPSTSAASVSLAMAGVPAPPSHCSKTPAKPINPRPTPSPGPARRRLQRLHDFEAATGLDARCLRFTSAVAHARLSGKKIPRLSRRSAKPQTIRAVATPSDLSKWGTTSVVWG